MRSIDSELPTKDGVAWFKQLDVVFADLYFRAYDAARDDPDAAPRAWVSLFAARAERAIAPIQFALGGMNALTTDEGTATG